MIDTKTVKDKKLKSPLINKKVQIALVEQKPNSLYKDKDQATLLTGASKSFGCPVNQYGTLINPLEEWEQAYLEEKLKIDLNTNVINTMAQPYTGFWSTKKAKLKITKPSKSVSSATIKLNLSDPIQFILYKIALINPRVCNKWSDRYEKKEYEFVIKDGEVELEEEIAYTKQESSVLKYIFSIENSKKKLFDLLRLYGSNKNARRVEYTSSANFIFNELMKLTRIKSEVRKLYKITTLGEKDIHSKIFLADAVTAGFIEKRGSEYRLMGGDKIGSNEIDTIYYLEDDKNQSIKLKIQEAIESFYKNK